MSAASNACQQLVKHVAETGTRRTHCRSVVKHVSSTTACQQLVKQVYWYTLCQQRVKHVSSTAACQQLVKHVSRCTDVCWESCWTGCGECRWDLLIVVESSWSSCVFLISTYICWHALPLTGCGECIGASYSSSCVFLIQSADMRYYWPAVESVVESCASSCVFLIQFYWFSLVLLILLV